MIRPAITWVSFASDGTVYQKNWEVPEFVDGRWRFWVPGHQSYRYTDDFHSPIRFLDRPETFDSPHLYLEWLENSGFNPDCYDRDWILGSNRDSSKYVRCLDYMWGPAFPGGYCRVSRSRVSLNEYVVSYSDYRDGIYQLVSEDKVKVDRVYEYLTTNVDLDPDVLEHLGMSC
jgi:hypothetical protein